MSQGVIRNLRNAAIVLLLTGLAAPAFAVDALFNATINRFHYGYYTTFATQPSVVGATQGGPANRGFTIPNGAVDGGILSYTASFPGFPYFQAYRTRRMTAGAFTKSFKVPGATYSIMRPNNLTDTQYPNALPTYPAGGYAKVKVGPNGFGGFWGVYDGGFVKGDIVTAGGGGGLSYFYFQPVNAANAPGVPSGLMFDGGANNVLNGYTNAQTICCAHSDITNQTSTSQTAGLMFAVLAGFGHVTGTATVSAPTGYVTKVTYAGADTRTASGLFGNISMVGPGLIYNYLLANQPTFDATTAAQFVFTATPEVVKSNLTFLPEPSQLVLLASGAFGLLALRRATRR